MNYWVLPVNETVEFARQNAISFSNLYEAQQFALVKNAAELIEAANEFRKRIAHYQMSESEIETHSHILAEQLAPTLKFQVFDSVQKIMEIYPTFFAQE